MWVIYLKLILSLFLALLGYGIVTPALVSATSDLAVLMGWINFFVIIPFILYWIWRPKPWGN